MNETGQYDSMEGDSFSMDSPKGPLCPSFSQLSNSTDTGTFSVTSCHSCNEEDTECVGLDIASLRRKSRELEEYNYKVIATSEDVWSEIVNKHDIFIFDCDGVLWAGGQLFEGVAESLRVLRALNKRLLFITNNSSSSRRMHKERFMKYGIQVEESEIVSSSFAAAHYLATQVPPVEAALAIGENGLVEELQLAGVRPVLPTSDPETIIFEESKMVEYAQCHMHKDVGAVVIGWDRTFDFHKMCVSSLYLQQSANIPFVATNLDPYDKVHGILIPSNGCAVAAVEMASGRKAINVGKPSQWLADNLKKMYNISSPNRTFFFGDRLDTDITFANNAGFGSALVLTGCTTTEDLKRHFPTGKRTPTYILPDVSFIGEIGQRIV